MTRVSSHNPFKDLRTLTAPMLLGLMATAVVVLTPTVAIAQPQAPAAVNQQDDWRITIYPILGWLPSGIEINVTVPPIEGGAGGGVGGGAGGGTGSIVDGRFD